MKSIVRSVILLTVFFLSISNSNHAQVRTTNQRKIILSNPPVGAIEIANHDNGIRYFGGVNFSLFADTTNFFEFNTIEEKYVTFQFNDGLEAEDEKQKIWFNNFFTHHYGSELICVEQTDKFYKILVNTDGTCYWLPKSKLLIYTPIENYLKDFVGVYITKNQSVRLTPDNSSSVVPIQLASDEVLHCNVLQIKGAWMQIEQRIDPEGTMRKQNFKTGWVKWFERNELSVGLIDSY